MVAVVAQPSTDHGREARRRIVDAACDLFYRQGVTATGLSQIATASRTGKGQLYHYFSDKTDLVVAVAEAQIERTLEAQRPILTAVEGVEDLQAWASGAVAAHRQGSPARCPIGALVVELADQDPRLRSVLEKGFRRWRMDLATALTRLQERGLARTDRTSDELAEMLLCAYEGGVLISEVHGDTQSLELSLDHALDAILMAPRSTD